MSILKHENSASDGYTVVTKTQGTRRENDLFYFLDEQIWDKAQSKRYTLQKNHDYFLAFLPLSKKPIPIENSLILRHSHLRIDKFYTTNNAALVRYHVAFIIGDTQNNVPIEIHVPVDSEQDFMSLATVNPSSFVLSSGLTEFLQQQLSSYRQLLFDFVRVKNEFCLDLYLQQNTRNTELVEVNQKIWLQKEDDQIEVLRQQASLLVDDLINITKLYSKYQTGDETDRIACLNDLSRKLKQRLTMKNTPSDASAEINTTKSASNITVQNQHPNFRPDPLEKLKVLLAKHMDKLSSGDTAISIKNIIHHNRHFLAVLDIILELELLWTENQTARKILNDVQQQIPNMGEFFTFVKRETLAGNIEDIRAVVGVAERHLNMTHIYEQLLIDIMYDKAPAIRHKQIEMAHFLYSCSEQYRTTMRCLAYKGIEVDDHPRSVLFWLFQHNRYAAFRMFLDQNIVIPSIDFISHGYAFNLLQLCVIEYPNVVKKQNSTHSVIDFISSLLSVTKSIRYLNSQYEIVTEITSATTARSTFFYHNPDANVIQGNEREDVFARQSQFKNGLEALTLQHFVGSMPDFLPLTHLFLPYADLDTLYVAIGMLVNNLSFDQQLGTRFVLLPRKPCLQLVTFDPLDSTLRIPLPEEKRTELNSLNCLFSVTDEAAAGNQETSTSKIIQEQRECLSLLLQAVAEKTQAITVDQQRLVFGSLWKRGKAAMSNQYKLEAIIVPKAALYAWFMIQEPNANDYMHMILVYYSIVQGSPTPHAIEDCQELITQIPKQADRDFVENSAFYKAKILPFLPKLAEESQDNIAAALRP